MIHLNNCTKMKAIKALSITLFLVLGVSLSFAQSAFEGVIEYKTTNAALKESAMVTWYHKKGNNLMEFDSKAGDYQMNYSLIMGSNDASVYMKSDQGGQEISGITGEEVFTNANFVRKMDVNESGYECEMLMFRTSGQELVYWMTDKVGPSYNNLPKLMRNNMPDMSGISNGFPVKMELRDNDGNLLRSQSLVSVKATSVDDSKFSK